MSQKYLVWRLCDGYANASTFESYSHEDAAEAAHGNDFEYGSEQLFCVQATLGDRKVQVISTEREMVPEYHARRVTLDKLRARCSCGAKLFDDDASVQGQCRRCWYRSEVARQAARRAISES